LAEPGEEKRGPKLRFHRLMCGERFGKGDRETSGENSWGQRVNI